jgi:hypothetical protein
MRVFERVHGNVAGNRAVPGTHSSPQVFSVSSVLSVVSVFPIDRITQRGEEAG